SPAVGGANFLEPGNAINFTHYSNPVVTRLLLAAKAAQTRKNAQTIWQRYSHAAAVDAAQIPPVYPHFLVGYRKSLQGLPTGPWQSHGRLTFTRVTPSS